MHSFALRPTKGYYCAIHLARLPRYGARGSSIFSSPATAEYRNLGHRCPPGHQLKLESESRRAGITLSILVPRPLRQPQLDDRILLASYYRLHSPAVRTPSRRRPTNEMLTLSCPWIQRRNPKPALWNFFPESTTRRCHFFAFFIRPNCKPCASDIHSTPSIFSCPAWVVNGRRSPFRWTRLPLPRLIANCSEGQARRNEIFLTTYLKIEKKNPQEIFLTGKFIYQYTLVTCPIATFLE